VAIDDRSAVVIDESVDCDRDELSDDVGDDNESDVGTNTHHHHHHLEHAPTGA